MLSDPIFDQLIESFEEGRIAGSRHGGAGVVVDARHGASPISEAWIDGWNTGLVEWSTARPLHSSLHLDGVVAHWTDRVKRLVVRNTRLST